MDQNEDPRELERKIEQASRIASTLTDQTTIERLRGRVEQLRQGLRQRSATHRTYEEIKARARELWEQNGCPASRDRYTSAGAISFPKRKARLVAGRFANIPNVMKRQTS